MNGRDVERAAAAMTGVLAPAATADWTRPAGDLDWSCLRTAGHVAHDLLAYAGQLTGLPAGAYLPFDLVVRDDASPDDLIRIVTGCARLLSLSVDAASPTDRAWHWGATDPGGFAALGVNEILIHTYDITRGLGIGWRPAGDACAAVLSRLFPEAPPGDPFDALLWCTGRASLPGLPRRTSWKLRAALD